MSGFMRKAALVVGAVALVAATAGAAAPLLAPGMAGTAGIAGVSAATLTAIGTYGGLAAGVLTAISTATAPGMSSQGSQTSFTTNPQSGLPYAMGRTRMSGLRIYAKTNTRPGYTKFNDLLWFGALLSIGGAIGGIEKFTADNEIVTFDASGNAIGDYHDYQAQRIHLGGQQTSALDLTLGGGSAPGWTTAHKLSGITHAMWCLRYNKQGEMYGAGAPEPAWIGNWVKVYDPRLDSTYPGGSGSCRALVESTYVWSDNPGLHALTWALGRWQNGKRTCGIGAPVANIRVAEFVECANVCEANGWKVGGVEWTTDSKWDSFKRILQAGGAQPTQTGAMIGCLVSTPRTAIATIESRHLLDSLSIAATKSRRDRFNSVIPRYVDEDSDWSVISGTAITVSDYVTADKGQRTKEIDYPLVQVFSGDEATQPGQLAAYDIVNSREAGPINFTTGPEWIGLKTGDVILLNVPEEGLVNQPVLITRRAPDPSTGKVSFSAQTETYAKHAYALGQSTTPPAPFSLTAPDLKPPAPDVANWAAAGTVTGEGLPAIVVTGNSEMPSADAVLIDYKLPADATWTRSAILSANEPVRHVIAPLQSETAYQTRVGYRVEQIDGEFTILAAVTTGTGKLTDISDTLDEHQQELDQLEQDTIAAQAAIAAAQQQIATIESSVTADLSAVNSAVAALNTEVDAAQGNISSLQTQAAGIIGSIGDINTEVDQISASVTTQGGYISTLQQSVTNLSGTVSTLSSTVATQGASIDTNAQAITTLSGGVATLTTRLNASSSPNMCPNGGFENGLSKWNGAGWQVAANFAGWGNHVYNDADAADGSYLRLDSDPISAEANVNFTASADIRYNVAGVGRAYVEILWYNGTTYLDAAFSTGKAASFNFDVTGANRQELKVAGLAPANTTHARVRITFYKASGTVTQRAVRQVKMERGTVATPYTGDAGIATQWQAYADLNSSFASLSTTVSSQGGSITTLQSSYTSLNGTVSTLSSTVSAQGTSITNLQTASSTQAGQIASLSSTVSTQDTTIASQATAITNLTGRTATLETTVSSQDASISNLQSTTSTLSGSVATLTTSVNATAPNLLPYGSFAAGSAGWTTDSDWAFVAGTEPNWGAFATVNVTSGSRYASTAVQPATPGQNYTISVDIDRGGTTGGTVGARIIWTNNGSQAGFGPAALKSSGGFSNDETGRVWASGVCPASGVNGFFVQLLAEGVTGSQYWRRLKVNMGTGPARYSDEASASQSFQALSTLTTQYASLSSTVATQGVSITSQATAITTLQGNVTTLFAQWVLDVQVGNIVAGIKLANNGSATSLKFRSDLVEFTGSTSTARAEFRGGTWFGYDDTGRKRYQIGNLALS